MKPSEIISLGRRQTGCTTDIVTEEEAYRFLNFVIEDFGAEIRLSDSGYGLKTGAILLEAGANTYTYQEEQVGDTETTPIFAMDKILKVGILQSNGKYKEIPVRFVNEIEINNIESKGEPNMCFYSGNKLVFVPTPETNGQAIIYGYNKNFELPMYSVVVGNNTYIRSVSYDENSRFAWINGEDVRYTRERNPKVGNSLYRDSTTTTSYQSITAVNDVDLEENIWIPSRWHHILVEGLKYRMYGNMGVNFETARTNSRAFYDSEKLKAIQQLTDRGQEAEEGQLPYLDFLAN